MEIRNIAIIAHVDHGKTTLVDRMIYQANLVRRPEDLGNLILDNNDLERERGITILAKNVSVTYKGVKINIIDTPGHSDFGGEVERVLNMADGVLLLVDAFEGCMPQTRFVLNKAIEMGKKPIVVINKVDKPNCRPDEVQEEVFELMFNLGATEEQLDFKTVYGSAKQGWMAADWKQPAGDITYLLDTILEEIPAPPVVEGTPQMLVSSLEYSPYVGRIAVGRITRGTLRAGMPVSLCKRMDVVEKSKIKQLMVFEGLGKANVDEVRCGDICAVVGIEGFEIGDTIADIENPEALPPIAVDEPTMSMLFMINNSPFFGKDGKYVTSRHIKDRLDRELEKNLALRVKPGVNADSFIVYGRGVLHLSVLIETMRREGFELQVGQPKVLDKTIGGQRCEPIEDLSIEVPEQFVGAAIELSTRRKGALVRMEPRGDRTLLEFEIPTLPALQGRDRAPQQRFPRLHRDRPGHRLFDEQAPGPRPFLRGAGRGDLRRPGGRRAHPRARPQHQYLQDQEAHERACSRFGREDRPPSGHQVLPRGGARVHPGRRIRGGDPALHAHTQDFARSACP